MITRRLLAAGFAGLAFAPAGRAQTAWPTRPVRVLVGFPAGGPTDLVARLLQEPLQRLWNQPVVVENRPGASQIIATEAVARAAPDGYTLLLGASIHATNAATHARLPYDTIEDFTFIAVLYGSPTVLLVPQESPLRTLEDLIAAARRNPGMSFATSGNSTSGHFATEMFARALQIEVTHVPFRGAAPALQEVVSGRIAATFSTLSGAMGLVQQGRLRALAVADAQRSPALPGVPTLAERGIHIPNTSPWYSFMGPRGMPREVVERIARDSLMLMRSPAIVERIEATGGTVIAEGPEEFALRIRREVEEARQMARLIGLAPAG
ncbi:MAG: tripartite tricarboxylate transporter substrate binding protein [Rhodovarius sp.]|nr:tripartite tricarboxylate transporter substrate binding protein [Rhodovarius sp.]